MYFKAPLVERPARSESDGGASLDAKVLGHKTRSKVTGRAGICFSTKQNMTRRIFRNRDDFTDLCRKETTSTPQLPSNHNIVGVYKSP